MKSLPQGFRARTLTTARLAMRLGGKMARRQLLGGKDADPETARDVEQAVATAERLVRELGGLKGLVMKVGQIASYMPGAMPPEAQRVLARLQAASTAMSWERVGEVLAAELGDRGFDAIDPEPFAAASIGQVHRARLAGRELAVKIQYPGIEDAIAADLRTIRKVSWLASVGSAIDSGEVLDELAARTLEECDYEREAANQRLFRALWADQPDVRVPDIVASRSTRRVLTAELVRGEPLGAFAARAPQDLRDRAGATVFRAAFHTFFHRAVFNADPHPGNYLFADDHVTFLDFGCIRRFDAAEIDLWKSIARSVLDDDRATFRRLFLEAGFVPSPRKFDWDAQWASMEYLYRPVKTRAPFRYTHDYVQQSYGVLIFDNPNQRRTAMPASYVYLNRLQWGLNSVLATLEATGRWYEPYREYIGSRTEPAPIAA